MLPFQIVSIYVSHDVFETFSLSFLLYFHSGAQCGTELGECTQDAGDATATDSSIVEFPPAESSACADMGTLEAAEEDCRASNNCGERRLAETNLSADCVDKRKEHCGELEDCAACEEEVRASYACMQ